MAMAPRVNMTRRMNSSVMSIREQLKANDNVKNTWLSDPAAYPILFILVVAPIGALGFIGYKFTYCPNVSW